MRALEAFDQVIEERIMRAGVKVPYAFAENPDKRHIYEAEDNGVIAELITHLSMEHDVHTNDIVVTTDPWLPKLEDPLKVYKGHMLYVVFMDRLYHPDYIQLWPWELHVMEWMAVMQRGEDDRVPLPRPQPMVRVPDPQPIPPPPVKCVHFDLEKADEEYEKKVATQQCNVVPKGNPTSYSPPEDAPDIVRAGMPRHNQHQDPKVVMYGWAEQKVRDEAPEAQGKTLAMIMRAEPRTVSAIMHAKSPSQTREVIIAAFRRAGLPSPFHPIPPPQQHGPDMECVMRAIAEQTVITGQIAQLLSEVPKAAQYEELVGFMRQSQSSYIGAVESLARAVARLESTIATWESAYLPILVGNVPTVPQPTPVQGEGTPTVIGDQDYQEQMEVDGDTQNPEHQQEEEVKAGPSETPRSLKRMQEKSLRKCCEKVIHEGGQNAQQGAALRPFRSTG